MGRSRNFRPLISPFTPSWLTCYCRRVPSGILILYIFQTLHENIAIVLYRQYLVRLTTYCLFLSLFCFISSCIFKFPSGIHFSPARKSSFNNSFDGVSWWWISTLFICPSSVQFSCSVVSNSFRPHGLQHTRPPCPLPTPGVYSDSCPLSRWRHPTISSSVIPFSSRLQSFSASGVFSNELALLIRWPEYWSFSFSISPSSEHSGLISFRMDWFDLLAVHRTLKSLLQHHSSKALILRHSAFFIVQLSHPYMTTGKLIGLTRWTFVGEVLSLLFNMLSMLVITILPRSKRLLISWLQSPSAVILEPKK